MRQPVTESHVNDSAGNPAGGRTTGTGIAIFWQEGPLGRGADRKEPNGAFVEGVIQAAIGRIEYYQASRFASQDNAEALAHLEAALSCLDRRTAQREQRGVEGTHEK